MTIKELIAALSAFDPDTPVVVRGYEGGYNDGNPRKVNIVPNVKRGEGEWYYGKHADEFDFEDARTVPAVCI